MSSVLDRSYTPTKNSRLHLGMSGEKGLHILDFCTGAYFLAFLIVSHDVRFAR